MAGEIRRKLSELVRGTAAVVVITGFLTVLAATVSVGSLLRDDDDRRSRSHQLLPPQS